MPQVLESGKYILENVEFHCNIGAPSSAAPIREITSVGHDQTVFTFERAGGDDFGRAFYRVKLEKAFVVLAGNSVVANASISATEATLWIAESKGDITYGLIPGSPQRFLEPLAWTLCGDGPSTPVTAEFVPQTKSLPPYSMFRENQMYRFFRVA